MTEAIQRRTAAGGADGKQSACQRRRLESRGFDPWVWEHGEGEEERQEVKWSTGLIWEG